MEFRLGEMLTLELWGAGILLFSAPKSALLESKALFDCLVL